MITSPGGPVGSYINALLKKRLWFKAGFNWGKGVSKRRYFKSRSRDGARYLNYIAFSHDVTAAILVSQNNEPATVLVLQTNPEGV